MTDPREIAAKLTEAQRYALLALPTPRAGNPARRESRRGFGDIWRKLSCHLKTFRALERHGVVQQRESRNETLWRLTPLGLAVRDVLQQEATDD